MPNILLLTKFRKPWNNGHYMAHALKTMGWHVDCIDTPSQISSLPVFLETCNYKLALATKAEGITPEIIKKIQKKGTPFVIWFPDPVYPPKHIVKLGKVCDFFFTMSEGRIEDYKKNGVKKIAWLTQAVNPNFFPDIKLTAKDIKYYGSEVTFIGTLCGLPQYKPRRQMLKKVIDAGFKLKWWGPKPARKLKEIPFLLSKVCKSYGGRFVYLESFSKVVKASKIFLSRDSYPDVRLSMSVRIYTALCCGAFYMCQKVEGIETLFTPGKEIEIFEDYDEMIDKIRYYLQHEQKRNSIAQCGQKKVLERHTYIHRFNEMFDILKKEDIL